MATVKTATTEELQAELIERAVVQAQTAATTELAELQPLIDMGFGDETMSNNAKTLKTLMASSSDKPWFAYLQAAVVGIEGLVNTVGSRVQYLNTVLNPPPAEEAPAPSAGGDEL